MPDKHEVGGSSPLGPTRNLLKKDFTFSLFTLHSSLLAKKKERKERRNGDNYKPFYGGVAQLGEHLPCKQGVMGSNPIISTNVVKVRSKREKRRSNFFTLHYYLFTKRSAYWLIAQVVRARA